MISYTLVKNRRSPRMSIQVRYTGEVRVSAPYHINQRLLETFIASKQAWIEKTQQAIKQRMAGKTVLNQNAKEFARLKDQALALVKDRLQHFNRYYSFTIGTIKIKNQRSRWGSCSKHGNLNFNYHILSLPSDLQDYLIVHELCHIKELNHSTRFWNEVAKTIPDYKIRRKALKNNYIHFK